MLTPADHSCLSPFALFCIHDCLAMPWETSCCILLVSQGVAFDCRASHVARCSEIPRIEEFGPASGRHEEHSGGRSAAYHGLTPDGPDDGHLVRKRPADWQVKSMLCRRPRDQGPRDASVGGDEASGRSLFQPSRQPTGHIAEVRTSDCNAANTKVLISNNICCKVPRTI